MTDLFQDPEFKAIRRINDEIFAVEQLCGQYGFDDVRQALFRVRVHEVGGRETFIRGRVKRENEAVEDGVNPSHGGQPCGYFDCPGCEHCKAVKP